jgi:hypothetical protein
MGRPEVGGRVGHGGHQGDEDIVYGPSLTNIMQVLAAP